MVTTRFYNVHVEDKAAEVWASCMAFVNPLGGQHRWAEFRLVGSTFDDTALSVAGRQPTFREGFRLSGEARDAFEGNEAGDEDFIKRKMREAFGAGVVVEVMFISPAPRLG